MSKPQLWGRYQLCKEHYRAAALRRRSSPPAAALRSPTPPPISPHSHRSHLQLDLKKLLPRKKASGGGGSEGGSGRGGGGKMSELPFTERELIQQCQREYETAAAHGGQEALDACFRCGWAIAVGWAQQNPAL